MKVHTSLLAAALKIQHRKDTALLPHYQDCPFCFFFLCSILSAS
ncbi:hypothetical protein Nmel_010662 [Mimus melanotis]